VPTETILIGQEVGVMTVTLNRPDKLNSANDTMLAELNETFKNAERDPSVRAILLTGAGRGFCAGQDLGIARDRQGEAGEFSFREHLERTYNPLILRMRQMGKPIVGAINGVAAGAGMSIAMACDFRIAAESASFLQAFVKIGLIPDSGSTWILPRLVGMTRALDMMLTGRKISAQEAFEWGLVNQVVPDADLMSTASAFVGELAAAPTKTIGYIKRALDFAATSTLAAALDNEGDLQEIAGRTADHHEGIAAFLDKRPPQFKGE
jgi:2-(1,2-epoxy-1,2-dihydrophenyl)acetyl-CoA isomerase